MDLLSSSTRPSLTRTSSADASLGETASTGRAALAEGLTRSRSAVFVASDSFVPCAPPESAPKRAALHAGLLTLPPPVIAKIFDALYPSVDEIRRTPVVLRSCVAEQTALYRRFALDARERLAPSPALRERRDFLHMTKSPTGFLLMSADANVRAALRADGFLALTRLDARPRQLHRNFALFLEREMTLGAFDGPRLGDALVGLVARSRNLTPRARERLIDACIDRLPKLEGDTHDRVYRFFHDHPIVRGSSTLAGKLASHIPRLRGLKRSDTEHRLSALHDMQTSAALNQTGLAALYAAFHIICRKSRSLEGEVGSPFVQWVAERLARDGRASKLSRTDFLDRTLHVFGPNRELAMLLGELHLGLRERHAQG